MDALTDQGTLILMELQEVIDAPKECEHSTHGLPSWEKHHDDEGAKWFMVGTHDCGRETFIYACHKFATDGLKGAFAIRCSQCSSRAIPFKDFYKICTRIEA